MRRISTRALVATLLGLALLAGGTLYVSSGLTQRYEAAQSAITVHEGKPGPNVGEYTFYSVTGDGGTFIRDNVDSILANIRASLLDQAEGTGSFTIPEVRVWVDESDLVAMSGAQPNFRRFGITDFFHPWTPHASMIPAFAGGLIMFAGLFWLAARWHLSASAKPREIDETPL